MKQHINLISTCMLTLVTLLPPGCREDDEGTSDGMDFVATDGGDADADQPADNDPPPPPPSSQECDFTYENAIYDGGGIDVWLVYLYPSSSDDIGPDLLGSDILPYGYALTVRGVPAGYYDTIVVDEDGYYYHRGGIRCGGDDWNWRITVSDVDGMFAQLDEQLDIKWSDQETEDEEQ